MQCVPALEPGGIDRWQVWAELETQADSFVEQLISASEDLRGLFEIPEDPAPGPLVSRRGPRS